MGEGYAPSKSPPNLNSAAAVLPLHRNSGLTAPQSLYLRHQAPCRVSYILGFSQKLLLQQELL